MGVMERGEGTEAGLGVSSTMLTFVIFGTGMSCSVYTFREVFDGGED